MVATPAFLALLVLVWAGEKVSARARTQWPDVEKALDAIAADPFGIRREF